MDVRTMLRSTILPVITYFMGAAPARLLRKKEVVKEGVDRLPVYTLSFQAPNQGLQSDFRIDLADVVKVVVPGYKPKSYSMSAMRDGEFDITFKVYPSGRASGYLNSVAVGDEVSVFRMSKKTRHPGRFVGIVAFGVGITEALPIAEAEIKQGDAEIVKLLWASRTAADTFWDDRIRALEASGKFELVHLFSRESRAGALHGRVSAQVLKDVFGPSTWRTGDNDTCATDDIRFLTVGTKEMMKDANAMLSEIGFSMPEHALLQDKKGD